MGRHSTVSDIFKQARYKLSDADGKKWTNERLLVLLNSGIRNIVYNTELLKSETYVALVEGQQKYDISEIALKISRIDFENKTLPFMTHYDLDKLESTWSEKTREKITAIIYDKSDRGVFKVYPRINKLNLVIASSNYGIITDIETLDDITYYNDNEVALENDVVYTQSIKVYYVVNPAKHTMEDDFNTVTIALDDLWDDIIVHWIVGTAFKDDREEENRLIGADNLKSYTEKLSTAKAGAVSEFTASKGRTSYNGGFN